MIPALVKPCKFDSHFIIQQLLNEGGSHINFLLFISLLAATKFCLLLYTMTWEQQLTCEVWKMESFCFSWIGNTSKSKKCWDKSAKTPLLKDSPIDRSYLNANTYAILNITSSTSLAMMKTENGAAWRKLHADWDTKLGNKKPALGWYKCSTETVGGKRSI